VSTTALAAPTPEALAKAHPEWGAWLALLEVTAGGEDQRVGVERESLLAMCPDRPGDPQRLGAGGLGLVEP